MGMRTGRERGQATVEFLALVPALGLLALVLVQVALLTGAWLSAAGAARAAARADRVGAPAEHAARAALPAGLAGRAGITRSEETIVVTVRAPTVVPGLGGLRVAADARR